MGNIITINFRPIIIKSIAEITHNFSIEQSLYFPEWNTDRFRFCVKFNRFIIIITTYHIKQYYLNWVRNNLNQVTIIITNRGNIVIPKKTLFYRQYSRKFSNTPQFQINVTSGFTEQKSFLFFKTNPPGFFVN